MKDLCGKPTWAGTPCQHPAGCTDNHPTGGAALIADATSTGVAGAAAAEFDSPAEADGVSKETLESMDALREAMVDCVESGRFGDWLESRAKFRNYSIGNQMLIWMQRPNATVVAPYSTWQALGRQVQKGEKSMLINVPRMCRITDEDPDTGEKTSRSQLVGFSLSGRVFDISQTEGDPLPELYADIEGDAPAAMKTRLHEVADDAGIPVVEEDLSHRPGVGGYWDPANDRIVLAEGKSDAEKATTLAHELGHAMDPEMGGRIRAATTPEERLAALQHVAAEYKQHRGDAEAVAESVSFMVARRYGLDASEQASGYVLSWSKGDPKKVESLLGRIDATAEKILPPSPLTAKVKAAGEQAKAAAKEKAVAKKKASKGKSKKTAKVPAGAGA